MLDHIGTYNVPYVDGSGILRNREETVLVLRNGAYFRLLTDKEREAWERKGNSS